MIAVIFEVEMSQDKQNEYLDLAAQLRPLLNDIEGFISIERFRSLTIPDKVLSLSFWRDEEAVKNWRNLSLHRQVQAAGRDHVFNHYRLRVACVLRDYRMNERDEAPSDSRRVHEKVV